MAQQALAITLDDPPPKRTKGSLVAVFTENLGRCSASLAEAAQHAAAALRAHDPEAVPAALRELGVVKRNCQRMLRLAERVQVTERIHSDSTAEHRAFLLALAALRRDVIEASSTQAGVYRLPPTPDLRVEHAG